MNITASEEKKIRIQLKLKTDLEKTARIDISQLY